MPECTDCGAEVVKDEMAEHMEAEHGVTHRRPDPVCECDHCEPCERARRLSGG